MSKTEKVFYVIQKLLAHPEARSAEIAKELKISKKQLIEIYHFIARKSDLRDLFFNYSKYPGSISPLKKYLQDPVRIKKIIAGKAINPCVVEIHLGEECNLNCAMCYSRGKNYREKGSVAPLNQSELNHLLDELKKTNVHEIWFSGGKEPLMSPLTVKTIQRANKLGFTTRLYTNGILLDNFKKRKIVLDCYQVRFSLNASTPITYRKIHFSSENIKDSPIIFSKVINNLQELVRLKKRYQKKVKIAISFILQPLNFKEISAFVNFAFKLGVDSIQIRNEAVGKVNRFTHAEIKKILKQIDEIIIKKEKGFFGRVELDLRGLSEQELNANKNWTQFLPGLKKAKICRAAAFKRGINPYGDVFTCEYSMHPGNAQKQSYFNKKLGNFKKDNFKKIISGSSGKDITTCNYCQAFEYGLNMILEKLYDDYLWGVKIEDQPFFEKK